MYEAFCQCSAYIISFKKASEQKYYVNFIHVNPKAREINKISCES